MKAIRTKKGIALWTRAKKIIPGGGQLLSKRAEMFLPERWPSYYKKAKGIEVWDLDNNHYYDFSIMGIGSCPLGYADPDVNRAVKSAIDNGSMCTLNAPEEVELAELLLKLHPWAGGVRYARTGGEAMAIAVRIARAFTGKDKIAFCGYHGWSDWYLAANLAHRKNLDGHLLPGLDPAGVPRGLRGTALPFHYNKIEELENLVARHKDIGVIAMEPYRHQEPEDDFLQKVRATANRIGAVLIFDEITIAWRLAPGGIHLRYKVHPDIAVLGKAMSNGYPMAAIIGRKNVMDAAQKTFISSTYWTERVGPVAALATINKMMSRNVAGHLQKIGTLITTGLEILAQKYAIKLTILPPSPAISFSFDYGEESLAVRTLFTQEMLRRGFLASGLIYVSYAHRPYHVQKYLRACGEVFALLGDAILRGRVHQLLEGPVAHGGFQRLT